jgi:hypothetical protein
MLTQTLLEKLESAGLDLREVTEEVKDGHLFLCVRASASLPFKSINVTIKGESAMADMLQLDKAIHLSPDEGFVDHQDYVPPQNAEKLVVAFDSEL